MPPKKKFKKSPPQHPIDASGVLQAAKMGQWPQFRQALHNAGVKGSLTFEHFNELPPGRTYGVIHQIAFHGEQEELRFLLERYPRVDLKLPTKDGESVLQVAQEHDAPQHFIDYIKERLKIQSHHELINKARDADWKELFQKLDENAGLVDSDNNTPNRLNAGDLNAVPDGRTWGVVHQIAFWGDVKVLDSVLDKYFPGLDLELETNEEAPQLPSDIAKGRGNTEFAEALAAKIASAKPAAKKAAASKVTAPSSSMKAPVEANGHLCNICYMEEHDKGVMAVACDNDHYICQTCFSAWVNSESDIEGNPQNILLNGGRITCVCKKASDCDSLAFGNKLIATMVEDEVYEKYLKARDFVVGKEAVAGALSNLKSSNGDMDAVEQEQIRNMYRTKDGSYSAYMCGQCSFGPVDHGWCSNLNSHHGEKKQKAAGGVAVVNNSCPKCGWFASSISGWPKWDGTFQKASDKPKIYKPNPAIMTVPQLKNALKLRGAAVGGNKLALQTRLQQLLAQEAKNTNLKG